MSDETDDNADFLAAELAEAQAEIDALRRERDEAVARAEKLQVAYDSVRSGHGWCRCHDAIEPLTAEVARLREALEEILSLPCDCGGPLDGGQHFHDCATLSDATFIARAALEGK